MATKPLAAILAGVSLSTAGILHSPAAEGSRYIGDLNLCEAANMVIIGSVEAQESYEDFDRNEVSSVYTRHWIVVDRMIVGTPTTMIEYVTEGGEYNGVGVVVGGMPRLRVDGTYLFFFMDRAALQGPDQASKYGPIYLDHLVVPPEFPLPDASTLQLLWQNLCAMHPEGIRPMDLRGKTDRNLLVLPLPESTGHPPGPVDSKQVPGG